MAVFDSAEARRLLDASFGVAAYVVTVAAPKLRLATTAPTDTAVGTEVVGGSYVAQNAPFASSGAAGRSNANNSLVSFTNMPTTTVTHVDIFDQANTTRKTYGQLTTARSTTLGDTLSFAIASITCAYA